MRNLNVTGLMIVLLTIFMMGCKQGSPEKLPKYKDKFKASLANFEGQKKKTDNKVEKAVNNLSGLQGAIEGAKDKDKEFQRVYGNWERVNNNVERLYKDFEKLKGNAEDLFGAMERQTNSLNDLNTKDELMGALNKTRAEYLQTLGKTESAINKLKNLHTEAKDVIKALEVAVSLGQISEISSGLKGIESKVESIMAELNVSIAEGRELYDQRIDKF